LTWLQATSPRSPTSNAPAIASGLSAFRTGTAAAPVTGWLTAVPRTAGPLPAMPTVVMRTSANTVAIRLRLDTVAPAYDMTPAFPYRAIP
jgi:hypothetical protein